MDAVKILSTTSAKIGPDQPFIQAIPPLGKADLEDRTNSAG